ncbi:MAG TPA: lamin tail domain-containing protein, partial [Methanotrichaceae archaeon]|nr:lamin tail domain-containing protein [Methanotrichaceae archaeon]
MRTRYQRWVGFSSVPFHTDTSTRLRDWQKLRLSSLMLRILLLAPLIIISISGALGTLQVSLSGPASSNGEAFLNVCDPSPLTYYTATISNPAGGAPASGIQAAITLPEGFYYAGFTTIQFPGWTSSQSPTITTDPDTGVTSLVWNISQAVHTKKTVALNEILPNPAGYHGADQKIELYNAEPDPADVSGWHIQDASRTVYEAPSGTVIAPESFLVLTPASLSVQGAALTLYDASNVQADQVSYPDSASQVGLSYACMPDGSGSFDWRNITMGATNGGGSLNPGEVIRLRFAIGASCKAQSGQMLKADLTSNEGSATCITQSAVPLHRADLKVTGEPGNASGSAVDWIIKVQNTGDGPAYNTVLKDAMGAGLTFVPDGTSPAPDSINNNTIVTWNLGDMPPGGSQTISIHENVSSSGDLSNDASASWGCGPDQCGTAQNLSEGEFGSGNLAIVNHQSGKVDPCGDPAEFQIRVRNTGSACTYNESVSESLPEGMEIYRDPDHPQGWYTVASTPEGINATSTEFSGGSLKWSFDDKDSWAPNTVVTIDFKVKVANACSLGAGGTAKAQAAYRQPNGSQATTEDELVTVEVYNPVLAIGQEPSIAAAGPGEAATWFIVVENTGDCAAKHVQVKDWLPSNVKSPISNRTFTGTGTGQDPMVWDLPDVAPGGKVCISLTATVDASTGCQDDTRNTARVYWGCCPDAFMPLTSEATLMTRPSLIASQVTDAMSTCGGTYIATISNPSEDFEVKALEIIDVVPEGLEYVDGSARIVSPPGYAILGTPAYNGASRTLNFTIDKIGKSETLTIAIDLKDCKSCCSDIAPNPANSLTLQYMDACGNAVIRSNTWIVDIQLPALSVSKTPKVQQADRQGRVGWNITVNNTGTGTASNVEITDLLGNGFTNIDASDGTSVRDSHTGWTTIKWPNQTIDPEAVWQRHITASLTNPQGDTTNSIEAKGSCISNECTYSQPPRDSTVATLVTASKGPDQTGIPEQKIDFPIDVRFEGNVRYDNVSLRDVLPPELDYVSGACTGCGGDPEVTVSEGKTVLAWDLGSFTGPRDVSFTVSTMINASALT